MPPKTRRRHPELWWLYNCEMIPLFSTGGQVRVASTSALLQGGIFVPSSASLHACAGPLTKFHSLEARALQNVDIEGFRVRRYQIPQVSRQEQVTNREGAKMMFGRKGEGAQNKGKADAMNSDSRRKQSQSQDSDA